MHKFSHIRQVAPMCPYGNTCCRRLSNNNEPCSTAMMRLMSNYFSLTTCYLWTRPLGQWHRKPSASSRVLYCGHSTQYSHLVTVSFAAVGRVSWNALVDSKDLIVLFGCQPVKQEAQPLQRDCTKHYVCWNHTCTVVQEIDNESLWGLGERQNLTPTIPKPLNRSSPKFA